MSYLKGYEHDQLLQQLRSVEQLIEEHKHEEARTALLALHSRAAAAKMSSAYLAWKLAIVFDCIGDGLKAAHYAELAVQLDPLALPFHGSLETILTRIRRTLADPELDASEAWIPQMYGTLQHLGEADDASHLAFAKHLLTRNDAAHALRVLEALTLLSPSFAAGWELLASVARKVGNQELAKNAEQQLGFVLAHPRFEEPAARA